MLIRDLLYFHDTGFIICDFIRRPMGEDALSSIDQSSPSSAETSVFLTASKLSNAAKYRRKQVSCGRTYRPTDWGILYIW